MRRRLCLLLSVLAFPAGAAAWDAPRSSGEAELIFRESNEALLSGEAERALEGYALLAGAGYGTAEVHYNLGNAALEAGHLGVAILAYERALRLDPYFEDARANLQAARRRNVDKLVGASDGPPFQERLADALPVALVSWAFVAAWMLLFGALIARRFVVRRRTLLSIVAAFSLIASLISGSLLGVVAWYREQVREGVVVEEVLSVRKGPAPRFDAAFEVHEGLKVRLLDHDGPYVRVRLSNGLEGWVLRSGVHGI